MTELLSLIRAVIVQEGSRSSHHIAARLGEQHSDVEAILNDNPDIFIKNIDEWYVLRPTTEDQNLNVDTGSHFFDEYEQAEEEPDPL